MGEELRSVLLGTAALAVAARAAVFVTVARGPVEASRSTLESAARVAALTTLVQLFHFAEELAAGFHDRFPEQLGLVRWRTSFFVAFNGFWLMVWAFSSWGLVAGRRPAVAALWFLGIAGGVNGIGHPLLAARVGGYFPGLITSVLLGLVSLFLFAGCLGSPVVGRRSIVSPSSPSSQELLVASRDRHPDRVPGGSGLLRRRAFGLRVTPGSGASLSRRLLQVGVAVSSAHALVGGALYMSQGVAGLSLFTPSPLQIAATDPTWAVVDYMFRALAGLWFTLGLMLAYVVPSIERQTAWFTLICLAISSMGVGRFLSFVHFSPAPGNSLGAMVAELMLPPALVLWQRRVARAHRAPRTGAP